YYERVTRQIYEQTEGISYVILDQRVKEIPNYRLALRTDQPAIEADTMTALAEKLGMPAAVLAETVDQYNGACGNAQGYDPLHADGVATSGLNPPKSNWARPIDQGPYMAYPIISA